MNKIQPTDFKVSDRKVNLVSGAKHGLEKFYRHMPVWAQNLGISLYGMSYRRERLGGVFNNCVQEFRARDRWSQDRMQDYLNCQLRSVLHHAWRDVPYYSWRWAMEGFDSGDFDRFTTADLPKLPITPKSALCEDAYSFVALDTAAKKKLHLYHSSGSTGTPITCFLSSEDHQRFIAAREARSFGWAGTSIRWPRSMIGGRLVVPNSHSRPPYYRYNWSEHQVYFSAFHISPDRVGNYVEGFNLYKPRVLTGYAHSHYTLARMMLDQGLQLDYEPTALVLGSEELTPEMKIVIGKAFRARAYQEYGSVEQCGLATECEFGSLHINPDFGIVEILDENDMPVPTGERGRIVCTGLLSETQPLIRYDIGDVGALSTSGCACGRDHLPVLQELTGRLEDSIVARDGRQIVRFHGLFVDLPHVLEGQVIQENLDFVRVRVVALPGFADAEKHRIRQSLEDRVGKIRIEIELVERIERTERGKFRAVISRVHSRNGESAASPYASARNMILCSFDDNHRSS